VIRNIWPGLILGHVLSLIVFSLWVLYFLPIFGWDVLSFWGPKTIEFLTAYNSGLEDIPIYSIREHRHPPTVISLQAGAMSLANNSATLALAIPFLLFLSVTIFMLQGVPIVRRVLCALGFTVITLSSVPLLLNHFLIHGYAEVYIGASMLLALVLWQRWFCNSRVWAYAVVAILCALLPIAIKNTGILYSLSVLLSFVVVTVAFSSWSMRTKLAIFSLFVACLIAPVLIVYNFDWSATWMGSEFSNDVASKTLWFGGYPLELSYVGFVTVFQNFMQAMFLNQSFGILIVFYLSALLLLVADSKASQREYARHFIVLATSCFFLTLIIFTMPQLISERVNAFSAPGMDTGYSRFLMPAAMLLPIPLVVILQRKLV